MAHMTIPVLCSVFCLYSATATTLVNSVGSKQVGKKWNNKDVFDARGSTVATEKYKIKEKLRSTWNVLTCSTSFKNKDHCQICARMFQNGNPKQYWRVLLHQRKTSQDIWRGCCPFVSNVKRGRLCKIISTAHPVWQFVHFSLPFIKKMCYVCYLDIYKTMNICTRHYNVGLCPIEDQRKKASENENQRKYFSCCVEGHIRHILYRFELTIILSLVCTIKQFQCLLDQQWHAHPRITAQGNKFCHCECLHVPLFHDSDNADFSQGPSNHLRDRTSQYSLTSCQQPIMKYRIGLRYFQIKVQTHFSSRGEPSEIKYRVGNWRLCVSLQTLTSKLASDIISITRADRQIGILYNIGSLKKFAFKYCVHIVAQMNLPCWKYQFSQKCNFVQSANMAQKNRSKILAMLAVDLLQVKQDRPVQKIYRSKIVDMMRLIHLQRANRVTNSEDVNSRRRRSRGNAISSDVITVNMAILLPMTQNRLFCKERVFAAIEIAMQTAEKMLLAKSTRFQAHFADSYCSISDAMNAAIEFYAKKTVTVFLGPVCDFAVAPIARQIRYWDLPMITPGAMAADFGFRKTSMFPLLTRVGSNFNALLELLVTLFKHYKWYRMKVIYMPEGFENIMDKYCHIAADGIVMGNRMSRLNLTVDYKSFHEVQHILGELVVEIGTNWGGIIQTKLMTPILSRMALLAFLPILYTLLFVSAAMRRILVRRGDIYLI